MNQVPAWLVVQNHGIAEGIVEGALTIGLGKTGEGVAAIGGDRCAGMLIGLALTPRESLKATTIWLGLSGLAVVNVSDWVMLGEVSVPVIRSTSVAP